MIRIQLFLSIRNGTRPGPFFSWTFGSKEVRYRLHDLPNECVPRRHLSSLCLWGTVLPILGS
jgi:hypothetical protein